MRVLVVDDDVRSCSVIKRGLTEEGYAGDVVHAGGGIVIVSVEQDGDSVKLSVADTSNGLAIRQSIDEVHSDTIEVESEVGVGTRFTVRLPRA